MRLLPRSLWALVAAAVALRTASFLFDILNLDEVLFGLIGRSILDGGLPYVDAIDIKPPLTYLAYTVTGLFGGFSLLPVHLLGVAWLVATCLVLREAARQWTGSQNIGWAAAWIALLASLCEIPSVNSELLMNLPVALALLCAVRAEKETRQTRFDFLCGASVAVASLFKHQAAVLGVGIAVALLWRSRAGVRRCAVLLLGFLGPWAVALGFYAAQGHLAEFLDWVFVRNLLYADKGAAGSALSRFAWSTMLCVGVALVPWILAVQETRKPSALARDPIRTAVLVSLWLTWLAVAVGGRFYEHYYLQFVPPLALAAAPRLSALLYEREPRPARTAAAAGFCIPAIAYLVFTLAKGLSGGFPGQDQKVASVSRWLSANSRPDQRVFVWGDATSVYYLSQRRPGTRYLNCAVEVGNFDPSHLPRGFDVSSHVSAPDVAKTIADLERNRVGLVVDTSSAAIHDWDRLPLSAVTALASYIAENYRLVATPAGVPVYARR
ncbi:MAG: glycosyltransferase family 39 protein [Myxococcales bacterium]